MGTKGRPFYRIVVAKSTAGRNGAFTEIIGTYDPVRKPVLIDVKEEKALNWLLSGAQPTETVAYLLKQTGVLGKFFEMRPSAKAKYRALDKRTAALSQPSVVEPVLAAAPKAQVAQEEPEAPEPALEPVAAPEPATPKEPAAESAPEETPEA